MKYCLSCGVLKQFEGSICGVCLPILTDYGSHSGNGLTEEGLRVIRGLQDLRLKRDYENCVYRVYIK